MEEETVWIFRLEGKHGLTISLQRWALFHMMANEKDQNWNSDILPLLTIVHMVSSNTVCMKSKWQGGFIHFFRRKVWGLFKDFPGPFAGLYEFTFNQAKCLRWKLCAHAEMPDKESLKTLQTTHSGNRSFRPQVDLPTSRSFRLHDQSRFAYTDWDDSTTLKSIRLH